MRMDINEMTSHIKWWSKRWKWCSYSCHRDASHWLWINEWYTSALVCQHDTQHSAASIFMNDAVSIKNTHSVCNVKNIVNKTACQSQPDHPQMCLSHDLYAPVTLTGWPWINDLDLDIVKTCLNTKTESVGQDFEKLRAQTDRQTAVSVRSTMTHLWVVIKV